jgi:hypothetical protein
MNCSTIIGIRVNQRSKTALLVQEILSTKAALIKTRLGIHEGSDNEGLILLQVYGPLEAILAMEEELRAIPSVKVSSMAL